MEILKKAAALADGVVVAVTELMQRAETPGNTYKTSDAKGTIAEVSITIPARGTGEVLLKLGRGLQNYPARAFKDGTAFARGTRVRVTEVGGQTVYVESLEPEVAQPEVAPPITEAAPPESQSSPNKKKSRR